MLWTRFKKTRLRGIERKFSFRNHWHGIKSVAIAQSSVHTCSPVGTKLQAPAFGPSLPEPCIWRPYTLVIKRKLFSVLVWRKCNNCWKSNLFQFRKLYLVALDEEAKKTNMEKYIASTKYEKSSKLVKHYSKATA